MTSTSLQGFVQALDEVTDLGKASHPQFGPAAPEGLRLARAIGRAQIVLLSSHFERYLRAINEESITVLNASNVHGDKLPETLRLLHSKPAIDSFSETDWLKRGSKLVLFFSEDGWLWTTSASGSLYHERVLLWMRSPNPDSLVRYYKYWGIDDIFTAITRTKNTRSALWYKIQGLIDLRNNIAHGDFSAQTTESDIRQYTAKALIFCERADRVLSKQISKSFNLRKPW